MMAPELFSGRSRNTAASDVYLLELSFMRGIHATSRMKVRISTRLSSRSVTHSQVNKRLPVPESMPPEVESLMVTCTNADPSQRPIFCETDNTLKLFTIGDVKPGQMQLSIPPLVSLV